MTKTMAMMPNNVIRLSSTRRMMYWVIPSRVVATNDGACQA